MKRYLLLKIKNRTKGRAQKKFKNVDLSTFGLVVGLRMGTKSTKKGMPLISIGSGWGQNPLKKHWNQIFWGDFPQNRK